MVIPNPSSTTPFVTRKVRFLSSVHASISKTFLGGQHQRLVAGAGAATSRQSSSSFSDIVSRTLYSKEHFPKFLGVVMITSGFIGYYGMESVKDGYNEQKELGHIRNHERFLERQHRVMLERRYTTSSSLSSSSSSLLSTTTINALHDDNNNNQNNNDRQYYNNNSEPTYLATSSAVVVVESEQQPEDKHNNDNNGTGEDGDNDDVDDDDKPMTMDQMVRLERRYTTNNERVIRENLMSSTSSPRPIA